MEKKKPRKMPKRVLDLVDKFLDLFEVNTWDISYSLPTENHEGNAAQIEINEKYRRFTITLYPCFFEATLKKQREYLLHEFCHLISSPMIDLLDDFKEGKLVTPQQISHECEQATSRMTNIFDGFLIGGWLKKRKAYAAYIVGPKKKKR